MAKPTGKVWLVGAGPGDPTLITVRGQQLLERAEVVLYDALSHPALLEHCPPGCELRNVGKRYGERSPDQSWISEQLIELARAGRRVVRLKGGDPLMFARGAEEAEALMRAGVPYEIVPGLSSPVSTAAYAGISLTHRDLSSSVTFITGSDRAGKEWSPDAWQKLATATDTICILMGMRRIEKITRAIIDGGRSPNTPAAVIQWGARPEQRVATGTLGDIAERVREGGLTNPAVIVVGEVVRLRDELRWYDTQPLFGKRVLVPRPAHQARQTAGAIRERGAEPIIFPVIEIREPPDVARAQRAVAELASYDWVVFTSANGVECTLSMVRAAGRDARAFSNARIAVIGPKTAAALAGYGLNADVIAKEYVGEGLARAILEHGAPKRVLIARALEAREELPQLLEAEGASVDVVPVYETVPLAPERASELVARFEKNELDVVPFTSSSTVKAVVAALGDRARELLGRTTVASIGPITSGTLRELSCPPDVEAQQYTIDGLLDALSAHFS